jgi:pilus assembly protein CpaB
MGSNETRTLWISIISAVIAVFLLYSSLQERKSELTKTFGSESTAVVAKTEINEMETIQESMLEVIKVPTKAKQPSAISDPQEVAGKVALVPMSKGEQILSNKVSMPGILTGLSLQVTPTKRAVTIPIDETRGVAKLLRPGDRIDIVAALDVGKGLNQRREVKTILQDVTILATGLRVSNELPRLMEQQGKDTYIRNIKEFQFSNITLEVTPDEAQDLVYILSTSPTSLFVSLRHPTDRDKKSIRTSTVEGILGRASSEAVRDQVRATSGFEVMGDGMGMGTPTPMFAAPPPMAPTQQPPQQRRPASPQKRRGGAINL